MLTIFLSSTSKDLSPCRDAAYRAIEGLDGFHCVRMEDFGSLDESPDKVCREKVGACDLFICIAGATYGSRSPAGPSYTEREFNAARLKKKPCLVFLTSEHYPLAANLIESDQDRQCQTAFRKKVSKGRVVKRFSTAEELSVQVVQAIRNWEYSRVHPTQAGVLASQIKIVSYRVAVLNRSRVVNDDEVRVAVRALQKQVRRDFTPSWGIDAEITFVAKGSEPKQKSWWLVIEDGSDYPNVVCYHTLTSEGLPQVKVSVINAKRANWPWTMAASHDLLEMLANPSLNLTTFFSKHGRTGRLYSLEICDPVRSPELAYEIDGVVVSNFVYPAWFESFREPGSTRFDHGGHISAAFESAKGAYMTVFDVHEGSGWRGVYT
jgi:hypothetical protein